MFIAIFPLEFATVTQAQRRENEGGTRNKEATKTTAFIDEANPEWEAERDAARKKFRFQCKDRDVSSFWQSKMFFFPFRPRWEERDRIKSERAYGKKLFCTFSNIDSCNEWRIERNDGKKCTNREFILRTDFATTKVHSIHALIVVSVIQTNYISAHFSFTLLILAPRLWLTFVWEGVFIACACTCRSFKCTAVIRVGFFSSAPRSCLWMQRRKLLEFEKKNNFRLLWIWAKFLMKAAASN